MAQKFTGDHFADFMLGLVGQPYWYGTTVQKCSESLLNGKKKQYPTHYGAERMAKYKQAIADHGICSDCVGAFKGYMWTDGGNGVKDAMGNTKAISYKYRLHINDFNADGLFNFAKQQGLPWGSIDTIPEVRGIAVRYSGHVGYYVGNGYVVEYRGFKYGCQKNRLRDRNFTHWYYLPELIYNEPGTTPKDPEPAPGTGTPALGSRTLKKGMKGEDVKTLQGILSETFGYSVGSTGIDGIFGAQTEEAVKKLQRKMQVYADGIYGLKTHNALMAYMSNQPKDDDEPVKDNGKVIITGKGLTVNVRNGNGVNYGIITVVKSGDTFPFVSAADNGWMCIKISGGVGWISGKYAERK